MKPRVYVVNRAADTGRLARFTASAEAVGTAFTRIDAIDGHDEAAPLFLYRDWLGDGFWGRDRIKPGAFACALSHVAAWRRMLADGCDAALICEDDAELRLAPDALFSGAARLKGADVVFANDRMAAWRAASGAPDKPRFADVADIVAGLAGAGRAPGEGDLPAAPGADAYLITRDGAKRLIARLRDWRIVAGIDWLLLAAGGARRAAPGWSGLDALAPDPAAEEPLRVLVAPDAVTAPRSPAPGGSAISHKTEIPIHDLRARRGRPPGATPDAPAADAVAAAHADGAFADAPALEAMARWFPRGGVYVDVGAHLGNHLAFMLRHGGAAAAVAFEFDALAIQRLRDLAAEPDLAGRVDASHLGFGLAEEAGKRAPRGPRLRQRLKPDFDETVKVRPGDALLRDIEPAMIKINVGGEEREVLKGLKKTLKRRQPILVIDESHRRSSKARPLLERLRYVEVERVDWSDQGAARRVTVFRPAARDPLAPDRLHSPRPAANHSAA